MSKLTASTSVVLLLFFQNFSCISFPLSLPPSYPPSPYLPFHHPFSHRTLTTPYPPLTSPSHSSPSIFSVHDNTGHRPPNGVRCPHPHHRRCRTRLTQGALFHLDRPHRCVTCQPGRRIQECRVQGTYVHLIISSSYHLIYESVYQHIHLSTSSLTSFRINLPHSLTRIHLPHLSPYHSPSPPASYHLS
jgi:hypothetical protein